MRISFLAATTLLITTVAASPALAGCGGVTCNSGSGGYASSGYTAGNTIRSFGGSSAAYGASSNGANMSNCPAGTSPSSDGTCLINNSGSSYSGGSSTGTGAAYTSRNYGSGSTSYTSYGSGSTASGYTPSGNSTGVSYGSTSSVMTPTQTYSNTAGRYTPTITRTYRSTSTSLGNYAGHSSMTSGVVSGMSDRTADRQYGSGSISASYSDGRNTIVPFTTSTTNISSYKPAGMGANEYLSPTQCPVSVYNPNGGQVMGCYSVSRTTPIRVQVPSYRTVRVVRPIIYVRYPVPVAAPFPVYQQGGWGRGGYSNGWGRNGFRGVCGDINTRYGAGWPGRPCG